MEITVSARHIDISPALRAAAEEKFGRLRRFGGEIERAEVHFVEERNPRISEREVCEVTFETRGRRVRARAAAHAGHTTVPGVPHTAHEPSRSMTRG